MTQQELSERLWILDARIGRMIAALPDTRRCQQLAAPLLHPATSFAPQYDVGTRAENRADLIEALTTSLTQLRATRNRLRSILRAELGPKACLVELVAEAQQLCRALSVALRTAKNARSPLPIARIMYEPDLAERLWVFDARVGKMISTLPRTNVGRRVARELKRSGTAFAPRYDESAAARTPSDLVGKLDIALKELRTTRGSLRVIGRSGLLPLDFQDALFHEANQLCRILCSRQRLAGKWLFRTPKAPAATMSALKDARQPSPARARRSLDAPWNADLAASEVVFPAGTRRTA